MNTHWQNLERHVPNLQKKRILDLGSGKGSFLIQGLEQGADIQGLELNQHYIAEATAAAERKGFQVRITQGVGEALPFADDSFDFINICEVIEHVEDPHKMLSEAYRVLAPGGKAYMSVPNRFSLRDPHFHLYFVNWLPRARSDPFIRIFGSHKSYSNKDAGHQRLSDMHYYTYPTVRRLAQSCGFDVSDIREDRIVREFSQPKKLVASLFYPIARFLYLDSCHLLLTKAAGPVQSSADERFEPVRTSRTFSRIIRTLALAEKKMLDLGCGFGEYLVRFGEGSLGITSTLDEVEYGKDHDIRIIRGNVELLSEIAIEESFEGIWANNLFEHLLAPHSFLMNLKAVAQDDTLLVLGVPVVPRIVPLMKIQKFRGALAAAHINFFTKKTLILTVERAGWIVKSARPFIFEQAWLDGLASSFAPHMYIIARNDAQFQYPEKKLKEWEDEGIYQDLLRIGNRADSQTPAPLSK